MAQPVVNLYRLGRLPYVKGLKVQQVLFDRLKARVTAQIEQHQPQALDRPVISELLSSSACGHNSLVLIEHEPVYTIGLRCNQYGHDYEEKLRRELDKHNLQADFQRTNRGGLITFHGPGQMVAYPIIYLGDFERTIKNRSVKVYVNCLESTIIDTLARVGLNGAHTIQEYPGVWLDGGQRKIAFVGIACKRYVTMHGISINCNCDLGWFDHIVSCGIEDRAITSVHREMLSKYKSSNNNNNKQLSSAGLTDGPKFASSSIAPSASSKSQADLNHNFHSSEPRLCEDVGHVSETFCESFAQNFNCSLLEKQHHELDYGIAKLII